MSGIRECRQGTAEWYRGVQVGGVAKWNWRVQAEGQGRMLRGVDRDTEGCQRGHQLCWEMQVGG